eukprot:TRINITY_DN7323_c0_g1_i2.p1 TRINITY_DN7323_c0_g1~~TRINITY_DN7323_c0_g1_i2.p1  ORF type:complete len:675 (-),score=157.62 TRINITY_DN7323_c0_g1_i2:434-2458(-)
MGDAHHLAQRKESAEAATRWLSRLRSEKDSEANCHDATFESTFDPLDTAIYRQAGLMSLMEQSERALDNGDAPAHDQLSSLFAIIRKQQRSILNSNHEISRLQQQLRSAARDVQLQRARLHHDLASTSTTRQHRQESLTIRELHQRIAALQCQLVEMPTHEVVDALRVEVRTWMAESERLTARCEQLQNELSHETTQNEILVLHLHQLREAVANSGQLTNVHYEQVMDELNQARAELNSKQHLHRDRDNYRNALEEAERQISQLSAQVEAITSEVMNVRRKHKESSAKRKTKRGQLMEQIRQLQSASQVPKNSSADDPSRVDKRAEAEREQLTSERVAVQQLTEQKAAATATQAEHEVQQHALVNQRALENPGLQAERAPSRPVVAEESVIADVWALERFELQQKVATLESANAELQMQTDNLRALVQQTQDVKRQLAEECVSQKAENLKLRAASQSPRLQPDSGQLSELRTQLMEKETRIRDLEALVPRSTQQTLQRTYEVLSRIFNRISSDRLSSTMLAPTAPEPQVQPTRALITSPARFAHSPSPARFAQSPSPISTPLPNANRLVPLEVQLDAVSQQLRGLLGRDVQTTEISTSPLRASQAGLANLSSLMRLQEEHHAVRHQLHEQRAASATVNDEISNLQQLLHVMRHQLNEHAANSSGAALALDNSDI